MYLYVFCASESWPCFHSQTIIIWFVPKTFLTILELWFWSISPGRSSDWSECRSNGAIIWYMWGGEGGGRANIARGVSYTPLKLPSRYALAWIIHRLEACIDSSWTCGPSTFETYYLNLAARPQNNSKYGKIQYWPPVGRRCRVD